MQTSWKKEPFRYLISAIFLYEEKIKKKEKKYISIETIDKIAKSRKIFCINSMIER